MPVSAGFYGPLVEGSPLTLYCVATGGEWAGERGADRGKGGRKKRAGEDRGGGGEGR